MIQTVQRITLPSKCNENTYTFRFAGPNEPNEYYVNLYVTENDINRTAYYCISKEDAIWMRDQLIERFPLGDFQKETKRFYHQAGTVFEETIKTNESRKVEEIATFKSIRAAVEWVKEQNTREEVRKRG